MRSIAVPTAVRDQLGESASTALAEMFDANNRSCVEDVVTQCSERFERRLVEEASMLRVEMAQLGATLRQEIAKLGSDLRKEMATNRVELLKWAFLFWVGQFVSVVGFVGLMLRMMPPR